MAEHGMVTRGQRVLVAVSGGPDSTALLAVLSELSPHLGLELVAAHLNHNLRGHEGDLDQEFVRALCQQLAVPLVSASNLALPRGANLEARARRARYQFLADTADGRGCAAIATGHTLDDQAETVLLRLLRGAGSRGLSGIMPVRDDRVIRPLLDSTRASVLAYLEQRGLSFRIDTSNEDRSFTRNRIRHDILPLLEAINPAYRQGLARTARIAASQAVVLKRHEDQCLAAVSDSRAGEGHLQVTALGQLPAADRIGVVRAWLRRERGGLRNLGRSHLVAVLKLVGARKPSGVVRLPDGQAVLREYDALRFSTTAAEPRFRDLVAVEVGSTQQIAGWQFYSCLLNDIETLPHRSGEWQFRADATLVPSDLRLRPARAGDRIVPFGMIHSRKLQDVFVDRKIPRNSRWGRPVLEGQGEILWVPGVIRSAHGVIGPGTDRLLIIEASHLSIAGP